MYVHRFVCVTIKGSSKCNDFMIEILLSTLNERGGGAGGGSFHFIDTFRISPRSYIDCVGGIDATRHEWHDFMVGLLWRKVQVQRGGGRGGRDDHGILLTF